MRRGVLGDFKLLFFHGFRETGSIPSTQLMGHQLEQIEFQGRSSSCSPPYPGEGHPAVTALPVWYFLLLTDSPQQQSSHMYVGHHKGTKYLVLPRGN